MWPLICAVHPGHDDPALRQLVRGAGDGLPADRRTIEIVTTPSDARSRRRPPQSGLGYAMAMGMVVIMAFSITVYTLPSGAPERWLRS
jgi:hypothetical protein